LKIIDGYYSILTSNVASSQPVIVIVLVSASQMFDVTIGGDAMLMCVGKQFGGGDVLMPCRTGEKRGEGAGKHSSRSLWPFQRGEIRGGDRTAARPPFLMP
jgi:hypothetical protein